MNCKLLVCLSLAAALFAPTARAVTFCVGDATALQNALMTANSNGEDDIVKIKPGTYAGGSGVAFAYSTSQSDAITISGGWVDLSIFDCVLQIGDPTDTVLSGSDVRPVLQMSGSGTSADMTLENLTIRDGNGAEFGGLRMSSGNFFGDLLVDRVYFVDNVSATFNGGASIGTQGTARVRNSWFRNNRCGSSICAVQMVVNHTNSTDTRGYFGNNTLTGNACSVGAVDCDNGGLRIGGGARVAIYNNAFYNNDDPDIRLEAPNLLFNNFFQSTDGSDTPIALGGNINPINPGFVNAGAGNFRLLSNSPLVDAGTAGYLNGTVDFDGNPRLNDDQYDIGAFENDNVIFKSGFEVLL
jgi:hypothetical protein